MSKFLFFILVVLSGNLSAQVHVSNNLCTIPDTGLIFRHSSCLNELTFDPDLEIRKAKSMRGAKLAFDKKSQKLTYYLLDGTTDTLLLSIKGGKSQRVPLTILNAPQMKAYWGTHRNGKISKEKLLKNEGLLIADDSIPYRFDRRIFSFQACIIKQSDTLLFHRCQADSAGEYPYGELAVENQAFYRTLYGSSFSPCLLSQLKELNSGDIVYIYTATVGCPSCIFRKLILDIKLQIE